MSVSSLVKHFKSSPVLKTDVSDFTYVKLLGNGGNSSVLLFEKSTKQYAVKFLEISEIKKVDRFKDEYFCASQIPYHNNISRLYHFDKIDIAGNSYFIIIMKAYAGTLKELEQTSEEQLTASLWKILTELCKGLKHLHTNGITHRDIKPQNIFYDATIEEYVIGDLGIAHFDETTFIKDAKTEKNERMANYLFSAPEQVNNKDKVTSSSDIFALGQVMHWLVTGRAHRGVDRQHFSNEKSPKKLKLVDLIVDNCLKNDPNERFQNIDELEQFIKSYDSSPIRNKRDRMRDLDLCIRKSFPDIKELHTTENSVEIERFLENFSSTCKPDEFWFHSSDSGNGDLLSIKHLNENQWLLNHYNEIQIKKIIVYKDPNRLYRSFFVLILQPSDPFVTVDNNGEIAERNIRYDQYKDQAVLWNNQYIPYEKTQNGFYNTGSEIIEAKEPEFFVRLRNIKKPFAYMIAPTGSGTSEISDREPTTRLLTSALSYSALRDYDLKSYLMKMEDHHSHELTMYD